MATQALVTGATRAIGLAVVRRLVRGEQLEALVRRTPLRRTGSADEVVGMVNMLCENLAAYITGQCPSVDGGLN